MKNLQKGLLTLSILVILAVNISAQMTMEAKYERNHDGDTYWFSVAVPSTKQYKDYKILSSRKCRMFQGDIYELGDLNERGGDIGLAATHYVDAVLSKEKFFIITYWGKDAFGRWLITIHFKDGYTLKEKLEAKGYLTGKYEKAKQRRIGIWKRKIKRVKIRA